MIGQRLRVSRSAAGLSLRGLEAKIDNRVTAQAISKYERNESMPSSSVIIALADALDVPVDYLVGDGDLVLESVEFRKKKLTSRRQEAQVEAKVLQLLERYLMVEELLRLPSVAWDKPREAPWPVLNDPAEAEQAALGLRHHWGSRPRTGSKSGRVSGGTRHQAARDGPRRHRRPYRSGSPREGLPFGSHRRQSGRLGRAAAIHDRARTRPHGYGGR